MGWRYDSNAAPWVGGGRKGNPVNVTGEVGIAAAGRIHGGALDGDCTRNQLLSWGTVGNVRGHTASATARGRSNEGAAEGPESDSAGDVAASGVRR